MLKGKKSIAVFVIVIALLLTGCNSFHQESPEETSQPDTSNEQDQEEQQDDNNEDINEEEEMLTLPKKDLQKGDKGEPVRILQEILIELGYEIDLTEIYNQETVWAITDLQVQQEDFDVTGIYEEQTREILELVITGDLQITPGSALAFQESTTIDEETVELGNPYEILALINKKHALPADYEPEDLVVPDVRFPFPEDLPKKQMRKIAAKALEQMFAAADQKGLDLFAQSGFRSYERQEGLFASYVSAHGEEEANTFSARPGESEHQSGLAMDVTSPDADYQLTTAFGETEEGIWLQENAADFGFIIRYPLGKEEITEYQYEPWHLRYVGVRAAKEIMEQEITLEEYLGELKKN
ncbi:D-alanyl-D-alanine carboxypeptidase family protein [Ornithinibacillus salinisoli]|uniref:D-alanyl-D-alanine carboxypeptidase family protein n=1 Tax=Ornithinibacillus salinisoli TaxID=1848459 RepID=A0ABW4W1W1_9BACI